jgi:hypothetical protein
MEVFMARNIFPIVASTALLLLSAACNLNQAAPAAQAQVSTAAAPSPTDTVPANPAAVSRFPLPNLTTLIPPVPITVVPKRSDRIEGAAYDIYKIPGDRIQVVCQQPCALDERLIDAAYAGYKVTVQRLVRTVGFDVVDSIKRIDIHLTRDTSCTRPTGEVGSSGFYPDRSDSVIICLYVNDTEISSYDPYNPPTAETAIRLGGLGVFAHEYAHALLFDRFRESLHDFVYPIEYNTLFPANTQYSNLCDPLYQGLAPLTYQLCQENGLDFKDLLSSLQLIDRLYQDGYGQFDGAVGLNQFRTILNQVRGVDVTRAFDDAGYQKMLAADGGPTPYVLPYVSGACTYQAQLVGDNTLPLGSMLDANTSMEKGWRVKNTGTCSWDGVQLVYVRGEAMTGTTGVPVALTVAGASVDVSVPMTAPAEAGVHTGEWRLRNAAGQDFGPIFNLTVYTRPGCSQPPAFSFFKAEPATIGQGAMSMLTWGQVTNADTVEIAGMGSVDHNGNRLLVQPEATTTYTLQATCGSNMVTTQVTLTVDTSLPHFAVSNVTASATPADFSGTCPAGGEQINFAAAFTSNGPGVALYRWNRNDSSSADPLLFTFDKAGTHSLSSYWILGKSYTGWMELKILEPVQGDARADFKLTCMQ